MYDPAPVPSSQPAGTEFFATVTEIREVERVAGRPVFQIALDHSIFPLQSGAPTVGTLTAVARSGAVLVAPITSVLQDAAGERWHTTTKPLQPGTTVTACVFPLPDSAMFNR